MYSYALLIRNLILPVRRLGCLTKSQLIKYALVMDETLSEKIAINNLNALARDKKLILSEYNVLCQPDASLDRKTCIAFWVFLAFAKKAGENYFAGTYPASLVFTTDKTYRIIVCEKPKGDPSLIALTQVPKIEGLIDIIAACDFDVEEVDSALLPKKDFVFAKLDNSSFTTSEPKISFLRVKYNTR